MSTRTDECKLFLAQWRHNRELAELLPATHSDWIVTALFYTAIHVVDAALIAKKTTTTSHKSRLEAMHGYGWPIHWKLHSFLDISKTARYSANPKKWARPELIEPDICGRLLYPIEEFAESVLCKEFSKDFATHLQRGPVNLDRLRPPPPPQLPAPNEPGAPPSTL